MRCLNWNLKYPYSSVLAKRIGCNMADEQEDHPDSSGKEVRLNSHFLLLLLGLGLSFFTMFVAGR